LADSCIHAATLAAANDEALIDKNSPASFAAMTGQTLFAGKFSARCGEVRELFVQTTWS
jgi:hypothetical protein